MFDSLESLFDAARSLTDGEYFCVLNDWLESYLDSIDWDFSAMSAEDQKFLEENPEWKEHIIETFFDL